MKSWLEKNDAEIFPTRNEWKPIVRERFIKTIKKYTYKKYIYIYIYNTKYTYTRLKYQKMTMLIN